MEEPSQNIVCQLSAWKTRKQLKTPEPKNDPPDHQFKELVQLLTVRELQAVRRDQQNQPQLFTESLQTSRPMLRYRSQRNPLPILCLVDSPSGL